MSISPNIPNEIISYIFEFVSVDLASLSQVDKRSREIALLSMQRLCKQFQINAQGKDSIFYQSLREVTLGVPLETIGDCLAMFRMVILNAQALSGKECPVRFLLPGEIETLSKEIQETQDRAILRLSSQLLNDSGPTKIAPDQIREQFSEEDWKTLTIDSFLARVKVLPIEVFDHASLEHLIIRGIKYLSPEIQKLDSLKILNIGFAPCPLLPKEISQLTNLRELHLANNQLKVFPQWICRMTQLERLNIANNEMKTLPKEICSLTRLKVFRTDLFNPKDLPQEAIALLKQFNTDGKRILNSQS